MARLQLIDPLRLSVLQGLVRAAILCVGGVAEAPAAPCVNLRQHDIAAAGVQAQLVDRGRQQGRHGLDGGAEEREDLEDRQAHGITRRHGSDPRDTSIGCSQGVELGVTLPQLLGVDTMIDQSHSLCWTESYSREWSALQDRVCRRC